jgi:hypothetical protein
MRPKPTAIEERKIVFLWERREETKPEAKSPPQYPREMRRKREPASSWPIFKSFSTAGIKGERMIRARKFKKKIPTKKKRGPIWDRGEE